MSATKSRRRISALQLKASERRRKDAFESHRKLMEKRDDDIRRALSEGFTQRQIAEITGISEGRIGQIAKRRR